jgi:hypothetical protein
MEPDQALRRNAPGPARLAFGAALAWAAGRLLRTEGVSPSAGAKLRPERRSREDLLAEARLWYLIAIFGSLTAIGLACLASLRLGVDGSDWHHALLFRLCLMVLIPVPAFIMWRPARERLRAAFWTTWWDPSSERPDGPIGWNDLLRMAVGAEAGDALTSREHFRRQRLERMVIPYALCLSATSFAVAMMIDALLVWRLPSFFGSSSKQPGDLFEATANVSGNLTAYLALLAAAISIVFTFRQLRAKVRSDNRQAWIDRARRLLSELAQRPCTPMDPRRAERLSRFRIELELMLNPSEKDHRLLLYLLQLLHVPLQVDAIAGARTLLEVVRDDVASGSSVEAVTWLGSVSRADPEQLVGYVVRLSHVVLKREWERVKHTR